jgi:predicted branched-subunit amino acid permease
MRSFTEGLVDALPVAGVYAASGLALAPSLKATPGWQRLLLAFGLTDEVFALTLKRFRVRSADLAYAAGVIALAYPAWIISTALAARVGGLIAQPEAFGLDVAFPAIFLGLVLPALRTRLEWRTAGLAVLLVLAGRAALPEGMALLVAGLLAPLVVLRPSEPRQSVSIGPGGSGRGNTKRSPRRCSR